MQEKNVKYATVCLSLERRIEEKTHQQGTFLHSSEADAWEPRWGMKEHALKHFSPAKAKKSHPPRKLYSHDRKK